MSPQEWWNAPDRNESMLPAAGEPAESPQDEALRFLEQLSVSDPMFASAALQAEINALLDRKPVPAPPNARINARIWLDEDNEQSGDDAGFSWYSSLLSLVPSLDDEKTYEAAREVEVGLFARERLERLGPSTLTRRELSELHTLVEEGEAAWRWLILTNIRLVFHWSKGVAQSIDPDWAQDAFQVGVLGLMRGLQGWDHSMGYRLSTFVSWHIRQYIQRWRANEVTLIRLPVHIWERLSRDDEPLSDEVAALVGRAQNVASLEAMRDRDEDEAWDGGIDDAERLIDADRLMASLFEGLTPQQIDILRLRHGIGDDAPEPMTLEEIGQVYGLTRERIRQIEKKSIDKLRAVMKQLDHANALDLRRN